ncbi:hypothetical protein Mahau_0440 [Mahella australiensis 50-1 BON]|uniref:DUF1573 domain-containing protein n=2 Tax=Thermoanaerobacterales Family IV. Incertae Sedis TaxID=543372 RepID=F3ZYR1_MAHA5|nr:hypothetical protein Mahau_0440 [Mahella australiensis 50-1 BON]
MAMKDLLVEDFQDAVGELLVRHKSILDLLSKYQESTARVNRAIVKAVTTCGCIEIDAKKQNIPPDATLSELAELMDTHLKGHLCDDCRDIIEKEMGNNIFYLANICNTLGLNMYDILIKEKEELDTLGYFNMK